jgi:hypothetical protein
VEKENDHSLSGCPTARLSAALQSTEETGEAMGVPAKIWFSHQSLKEAVRVLFRLPVSLLYCRVFQKRSRM